MSNVFFVFVTKEVLSDVSCSSCSCLITIFTFPQSKAIFVICIVPFWARSLVFLLCRTMFNTFYSSQTLANNIMEHQLSVLLWDCALWDLNLIMHGIVINQINSHMDITRCIHAHSFSRGTITKCNVCSSPASFSNI